MRLFLLIFLASLTLAQGGTTLLTKSGQYPVDGAGRPVVLVGGHLWESVGTTSASPADFSWANWLNLITSTNWNFQRLWIFDEILMSHGAMTPLPFQRTGPGNAADGSLKFDLTAYNQTYFDTLSNHVADLDARGVYCSVMFFQGVRVTGAPSSWNTNIWNTANNINGVLSSTNDLYTMNNSTHLSLLTNYIRKVVLTLNGFNNVIWEIGNEMPWVNTAPWQSNMVALVKGYEATLPKQHLVGITAPCFQTYTHIGVDPNPWMVASGADWYSAAGYVATDTWKTNPPANTSGIISILDTDHIWGVNGTSTWVWRSFLRGHCPINQDTPGSGYSDFASDNTLRNTLGHINRIANRVNMATMVPANSMASTGFCLTNSALQYIALYPDNANGTMKLPAGRYYYEKWNATTAAGAVQERGYVSQSSGGDFTWATPGNGFVVLCIGSTPQAGIDFDGTDDSVDCGSASTLDDVVQKTIAAWIFPRTLGGNGFGRIVSKEVANGGPIEFFCGTLGGANVLAYNESRSTLEGVWRTPVNSITLNQWNHVAVTYNNSSTANDAVLYINGVSQTITEHVTPSGTLTSDAASNFRIGNSGAGARAFDGMIADVRFYNRILPAAEILNLYNSRGRSIGNTTGLVGYWPLGDGPGGTSADGDNCSDRSGKGSHGTGSDGANNTGLTWKQNALLSED